MGLDCILLLFLRIKNNLYFFIFGLLNLQALDLITGISLNLLEVEGFWREWLKEEYRVSGVL